MKTISIVLACSLLAMVAFVRAADSAAAPTTRPSREDENRDLRAELRAKDRQLKVLSDQLRKTEEELAQLKLRQRLATLKPQVPQVQPFSLAPGNPLPPGSVPHRFNGSTFYLVPLAGNAIMRGNSATVKNVSPVTPESLIELQPGCFIPPAR